MLSKAVWKGTLNVSLLNVGVKLFKATDDNETHLRELHDSCGKPMNRKTVCNTCGVDVLPANVVKGVPQPDGTFVQLTADDIKSIKPESSEVIAVTAFVPLQTVDPLYIEDAHYVMPDGGKNAQDAYALFVRGLQDAKRAAQARFCIYGRERTVTLRAVGSVLVMQSMRDANHVRDMSELPGYLPSVKVDPNALKLVAQLIDQYAASSFDPSEFEDTHATALAALVAARKDGTPVPAAPAPVKAVNPGDLMAALRASLDAKPTRKAPVKVERAATKRKKVG
jgi:DNA end-binding protein Ku